MRGFILSATGLALIALVGCVTPEDQQAADQNRCASFGFQPGTDGYANCMMSASLQRDQQAADWRLQRDQQTADAMLERERWKQLSQLRRGDDRFPVCQLSDPDVHLDFETGKWVGPNCQASD